MQEALLQYIWKNSLFANEKYTADTREEIVVIDTGKHNHDGGPDFTNGRIKINGTIWAGNIEVHINASDWYTHNHHTDPAYNNVILHVVIHSDRSCSNAAGRRIPCIELRFNPEIEHKYQQLISSPAEIHCQTSLPNLDRSLVSFWLSALAIERLQAKISTVQGLLKITRNNWEETFYIFVAHSFGLKINALPFELLARSIPLKVLTSHSQSIIQLEALLFGQAGFLDEEPKDKYQLTLHDEYRYLGKKYSLRPIEKHLWKFLRLRPVNFPTVRIAQFASLIKQSDRLFSKTIDSKEPGQLVRIYNCEVSEYWKNHYTFGSITEHLDKKLGKATIFSIIINTIVPFMFIYGEQKNNNEIQERAIRLLEKLPAEKNRITGLWDNHGVQCINAAESQALIELTTKYCNARRCIDCQLGLLILKTTV